MLAQTTQNNSTPLGRKIRNVAWQFSSVFRYIVFRHSLLEMQSSVDVAMEMSDVNKHLGDAGYPSLPPNVQPYAYSLSRCSFTGCSN